MPRPRQTRLTAALSLTRPDFGLLSGEDAASFFEEAVNLTASLERLERIFPELLELHEEFAGLAELLGQLDDQNEENARLIAEEKRNGTIELLITMPVKDSEVILGKFLGVFGLYLVLLLLTLPYPMSISTLGNLDWGPVWTGYFGLVLQGAARRDAAADAAPPGGRLGPRPLRCCGRACDSGRRAPPLARDRAGRPGGPHDLSSRSGPGP